MMMMMLSLPHTHAVHGSLLPAAARSHPAQGKTACGFPQPSTPPLSGHGAAWRDPTAQLLQCILNMYLSHVGPGMEGSRGLGCWWHSTAVTTAHPQHLEWNQATACAIRGLGSPSPVHANAAPVWAVSSGPSPVPSAWPHVCRVITPTHAGAELRSRAESIAQRLGALNWTAERDDFSLLPCNKRTEVSDYYSSFTR